MVEEREEKLKALQAMLDKSLAEGSEATEQDIDAAIEAKAVELAKEGF